MRPEGLKALLDFRCRKATRVAPAPAVPELGTAAQPPPPAAPPAPHQVPPLLLDGEIQLDPAADYKVNRRRLADAYSSFLAAGGIAVEEICTDEFYVGNLSAGSRFLQAAARRFASLPPADRSPAAFNQLLRWLGAELAASYHTIQDVEALSAVGMVAGAADGAATLLGVLQKQGYATEGDDGDTIAGMADRLRADIAACLERQLQAHGDIRPRHVLAPISTSAGFGATLERLRGPPDVKQALPESMRKAGSLGDFFAADNPALPASLYATAAATCHIAPLAESLNRELGMYHLPAQAGSMVAPAVLERRRGWLQAYVLLEQTDACLKAAGRKHGLSRPAKSLLHAAREARTHLLKGHGVAVPACQLEAALIRATAQRGILDAAKAQGTAAFASATAARAAVNAEAAGSLAQKAQVAATAAGGMAQLAKRQAEAAGSGAMRAIADVKQLGGRVEAASAAAAAAQEHGQRAAAAAAAAEAKGQQAVAAATAAEAKAGQAAEQAAAASTAAQQAASRADESRAGVACLTARFGDLGQQLDLLRGAAAADIKFVGQRVDGVGQRVDEVAQMAAAHEQQLTQLREEQAAAERRNKRQLEELKEQVEQATKRHCGGGRSPYSPQLLAATEQLAGVALGGGAAAAAAAQGGQGRPARKLFGSGSHRAATRAAAPLGQHNPVAPAPEPGLFAAGWHLQPPLQVQPVGEAAPAAPGLFADLLAAPVAAARDAAPVPLRAFDFGGWAPLGLAAAPAQAPPAAEAAAPAPAPAPAPAYVPHILQPGRLQQCQAAAGAAAADTGCDYRFTASLLAAGEAERQRAEADLARAAGAQQAGTAAAPPATAEQEGPSASVAPAGQLAGAEVVQEGAAAMPPPAAPQPELIGNDGSVMLQLF